MKPIAQLTEDAETALDALEADETETARRALRDVVTGLDRFSVSQELGPRIGLFDRKLETKVKRPDLQRLADEANVRARSPTLTRLEEALENAYDQLDDVPGAVEVPDETRY